MPILSRVISWGGRKRAGGAFPSSVQTELGTGTVLRAGLGSKGAAPHVFQVVLSACSKKHDFGRGFCWAVPRSQAPARPGRATQANCFHVLHGGQTDNSPPGRGGGRNGEREQGLVCGQSEKWEWGDKPCIEGGTGLIPFHWGPLTLECKALMQDWTPLCPLGKERENPPLSL